jgi:hypothetical protein
MHQSEQERSWIGSSYNQIEARRPAIEKKNQMKTWVAWPTNHYLASNQPPQVGGGHIHPYKYHLTVKVEIPYSSCSSPLVKILV